MAMLMVAGGKIGSMIGRRRAFVIGCVVYGLGSLTTALAPNLTVLVIGWSVLEGIGAALILPAIVALVASNFPAEGRPRAYGLVMGAGAIAVAVGPLIGGIATTYFSWRWVFAGEVIVVIGILALARRVQDAPPEARRRFDVAGAVLAAVGLGAAVLGILRSSEWGGCSKAGRTSLLGMSPPVWFVLAGLLVTWLFFERESRLEAAGENHWSSRRCSATADDRGPADVLRALPRASRDVLHHPTVPVGVARPVRARHRPAHPAALGHPAGCGGRHPRFFPTRPRAAWCGSGARCSPASSS